MPLPTEEDSDAQIGEVMHENVAIEEVAEGRRVRDEFIRRNYS